MANTATALVRTALAGVITDAGHTVYPFGVNVDHTGRTFVTFGRITSEQEPLAFGNVRVETLEVEVVIVHQAGGASTAAATAGETVVLAVVDDIEDALRSDITVDGVVFNAEPSSRLEVDVLANDDGWVFQVSMSIDVEVHI